MGVQKADDRCFDSANHILGWCAESHSSRLHRIEQYGACVIITRSACPPQGYLLNLAIALKDMSALGSLPEPSLKRRRVAKACQNCRLQKSKVHEYPVLFIGRTLLLLTQSYTSAMAGTRFVVVVKAMDMCAVGRKIRKTGRRS